MSIYTKAWWLLRTRLLMLSFTGVIMTIMMPAQAMVSSITIFGMADHTNGAPPIALTERPYFTSSMATQPITISHIADGQGQVGSSLGVTHPYHPLHYLQLNWHNEQYYWGYTNHGVTWTLAAFNEYWQLAPMQYDIHNACGLHDVRYPHYGWSTCCYPTWVVSWWYETKAFHSRLFNHLLLHLISPFSIFLDHMFLILWFWWPVIPFTVFFQPNFCILHLSRSKPVNDWSSSRTKLVLLNAKYISDMRLPTECQTPSALLKEGDWIGPLKQFNPLWHSIPCSTIQSCGSLAAIYMYLFLIRKLSEYIPVTSLSPWQSLALSRESPVNTP